jgi:hypothetical protein
MEKAPQQQQQQQLLLMEQLLLLRCSVTRRSRRSKLQRQQLEPPAERLWTEAVATALAQCQEECMRQEEEEAQEVGIVVWREQIFCIRNNFFSFRLFRAGEGSQE